MTLELKKDSSETAYDYCKRVFKAEMEAYYHSGQEEELCLSALDGIADYFFDSDFHSFHMLYRSSTRS